MSTLYLGTDIDLLAQRLAAGIGASLQADFFAPVTITVPNRHLERWLRLRLARQQGVAINLRLEFLETLLWELLRELDGRAHELPLEPMPEDTYRLMILSVLLDEQEASAELAPLREYLVGQGLRRRDCARRAWQLAARLGDLIRDYEFHRRDMILRWLSGEDALEQATADQRRLERSQRALFQVITREPDGLRARLSRASGKLFKTLPQYAGELMELPPAQLRPPGRRTVHVFGVTYLSAFHHLVLGFLGERFDLRLYYVNPLVGRLPDACAPPALRELAGRYAVGQAADPAAGNSPGDDLLRVWGPAGAEGLGLMATLLESHQSFTAQVVRPDQPTQVTTLLGALQGELLGPTLAGAAGSQSPSQDTSLQIVACPGVYREVETVYQSILHNLQTTRELKQTDIAVLVTDLERYRPVLQAVFSRDPRLVGFQLGDGAVGGSGFGQAVLGLLDLALEAFTRSQVFAVLLNPCFLARLGVAHEQALVWLDWVEALGVYHAWDPGDKRERGYPDSRLYSWQLGLQRLRLGRLMEVGAEGGPAPRYGDVVPFADLASGDREQLDAFCRAVEGLLPRLVRLRQRTLRGAAWADELRRLVADFLDVPADRPEDERLRGRLLAALDGLGTLDRLGVGGREPALPLSLVREFVLHQLEELGAASGAPMTGGVTIGRLAPLRTLPFRVVYIVGLEEGTFPGPNQLPTYDLRGRQRCPGDVRPAEGNRFLFLDALLAARAKVYLLYNCRDLQKDRDLEPASPVNQLRRYLETRLLAGRAFQVERVPLAASDPRYLTPSTAPWSDVLVNYNEADRLLAVLQAEQAGAVRLDDARRQELDACRQRQAPALDLTPGPHVPLRRPPTVTLRELRGFLACPAEAALKRHLHLADDDEFEPADDEPFVTPSADERRLVTEFLNGFVARAVADGVDGALAGWRERFAALYHEWGLRGRTPEDAFGQADRARFEKLLQERLEGDEGLAAFLRARQDADFVGPVLLGESLVPVGPRTRFPALKLSRTPDLWTAHVPPDARLCGMLPLVWRDGTAVDVLVFTWSKSKVLPDHLSGPLLEPALCYLALLAGSGQGSDSSRRWLGRRAFRVHVASPEKIVTMTYQAGDIKPAEASAYLIELLRDFLDRASFDLLPFDLFFADRDLRDAYLIDAADPGLPALQQEYKRSFEEAYDDDQEKEIPSYWPMKLLEIAEVSVPDDAFDKVRLRFRLLDRGFARLRAQPAPAKGEGKARRGQGKREASRD